LIHFVKMKNKKETLEEAEIFTPQSDKWTIKEIFIEGAKWQAKRMYSEEDLEVAYFEGREGLYSFNDWFEKFKKR
jgi:hypothetical protein